MDIRCRKLNCKYNDRFTCRAKELEVTAKGDCGVYEKTDKEVHDTTKHIFSKVPDYYGSDISFCNFVFCNSYN